MDCIINSELLNFLLSEYIITKQQHGFIQKRTNCTNLLESILDWTLNLQACRILILFTLTLKRLLTLSLNISMSSSSQLMVCLVNIWHG